MEQSPTGRAFGTNAREGQKKRKNLVFECRRERAPQRQIEVRDELDSTRADSPLRRAPDAILVTTDERTVEEVLAVTKKAVTTTMTDGDGK